MADVKFKTRKEAREYFYKQPAGTATIHCPGDGYYHVIVAEPAKKIGKLKEVKDNG